MSVTAKHPAIVVSHGSKRMGPRRRGLMLFEAIVATVVVGTLVTTFVPLLISVSHQRRAAERRQLAQQLAANAMERVSLLDWKALTPEHLAGITLPEPAQRSLTDGRLDVKVEVTPAQSDVKKVTVAIAYRNRAGELMHPVRLVAWFHRQKGDGS